MNRFLFTLKAAVLRYWQIILIISTIIFFELLFVPINRVSGHISLAITISNMDYIITILLPQANSPDFQFQSMMEPKALFIYISQYIAILIPIVLFIIFAVLVMFLHKKRPRTIAFLSIPFICLSLSLGYIYSLLYFSYSYSGLTEYYYSNLKFEYGFYLTIASSIIALIFAILTLSPTKIPNDNIPIIKIRRIPSRTRRLEELEREVEELRSRVNS